MRRRSSRRRNFESLPFSVRLGQALRRYFLAGLATLFPLWVTLYLLVKIFEFADGLLGRHLAIQVPGLGLLLTGLILLAVGFLSTHFLGRIVFPTIELSFSRLPIVRNIYPAVKQLTRFLFNDGGQHAAFRRVALIEYPRAGSYTLAFVTGEGRTSVTGTSQKMLTLLIPTPPSPFSGPLVFLPEREVIPLTMSVEEAVKLIVSGGVVTCPLQSARESPPPP